MTQPELDSELELEPESKEEDEYTATENSDEIAHESEMTAETERKLELRDEAPKETSTTPAIEKDQEKKQEEEKGEGTEEGKEEGQEKKMENEKDDIGNIVNELKVKVTVLDRKVTKLKAKLKDMNPNETWAEFSDDDTGADLDNNEVPRKLLYTIRSCYTESDFYSLGTKPESLEEANPVVIPMIDVWMESLRAARLPLRDISRSLASQKGAKSHSDALGAHSSGLVPVSEPQLVPGRVRIRSLFLLDLLQHVAQQTGTSAAADLGHRDAKGEGEANSDQISFVFLHPFKFFVTYEEAIRETATDLAARFAVESDISREIVGAPTLDVNEQNDDSVPGRFVSRKAYLELRVLVKLFDEQLKSIFQKRHDFREAKATTIAFEDFWLLFELGDLVYQKEKTRQDLPKVYKLTNFTGGRPILNNKAYNILDPKARQVAGDEPSVKENSRGKEGVCFLRCFCLASDGKKLVPIESVFKIPAWDGEREIRELIVFPVKYCEPTIDFAEESIADWKTSLITEGKEFAKFALKGGTRRLYEGVAVDEDKNEEQHHTQVIIDISLARLEAPRLFPEAADRLFSLSPLPDRQPTSLIVYKGDIREVKEEVPLPTKGKPKKVSRLLSDVIHDDISMDFSRAIEHRDGLGPVSRTLKVVAGSELEIREDDYLLFPPDVSGFLLSTRKWANLLVSKLRPCEQDKALWKELKLSHGYKEALLSAVQDYVRSDDTTLPQADLVKGKGTGAIILLHGPPGVGKTFTVDAIAAYTNRAVYSMTFGELGGSVTAIEKNLGVILRRGQKWGCILLLDEADVFFTPRSLEDLGRNSIVSIFLRYIEYYSGIMFLTTNRLRQLDQAILSRVTLPLYYPPLNRRSTERIWNTYADNLKRFLPRSFLSETDTTGPGGPKLSMHPDTRNWWKDKYEESVNPTAPDMSDEQENASPWWSGRQIQNSFRQAVALALYEKAKGKKSSDDIRLRSRHFDKVAKRYEDFQNEMHRMPLDNSRTLPIPVEDEKPLAKPLLYNSSSEDTD